MVISNYEEGIVMILPMNWVNHACVREITMRLVDASQKKENATRVFLMAF